jgi:hypothetical protein
VCFFFNNPTGLSSTQPESVGRVALRGGDRGGGWVSLSKNQDRPLLVLFGWLGRVVKAPALGAGSAAAWVSVRWAPPSEWGLLPKHAPNEPHSHHLLDLFAGTDATDARFMYSG